MSDSNEQGEEKVQIQETSSSDIASILTSDNLVNNGNIITNTLLTDEENILKKIMASTLPTEVHENEAIKVTIDGVTVNGIWVNKEDSIYWHPDHPLDKRNPINLNDSELVISSADAEIIKKTYKLTGDQIQNVGIKFLKPHPPCVGDLIIEQLSDLHLKPLPPIWIQEKQEKANQLPPQVIREKPRILECVPEQTIRLDPKLIVPPRQVIVERLPKLDAKIADLYVERWLGMQSLKRQVKYKEANVQLKAPVLAKNKIVNWSLEDERQMRQRFNYLGIDAPVDPEAYVKQYNATLIESERMPEYANHFNAEVQTKGEILSVNQPLSSEFQLEHADSNSRSALDKAIATAPTSTSSPNMQDYVVWNTQYKNEPQS